MSLSMYQASVPPLIRTLTNLRGVLIKGLAFVEHWNIDEAVLIHARLYPNMFSMARQVQIATDNAKGCASRLAGLEPPGYEDNETTFIELIARIDKTIDYLQTISPEQIDGSEDRPITLKLRHNTYHFKGMPYLIDYVLPTVYFHVVTAYAILRHNGVEVGKQDYLGAID